MNVFQNAPTTMTPEEAEAVVRRHLERTPEAPNGPTVADMAEALRVSPEEVAKLLAEVRAEPRLRRRRAVSRRERRVWLLSGVAALLVGGLGLVALRSAAVGPFGHSYDPPHMVPFEDTYHVYVSGEDRGFLVYNAQMDGAASSVLPQKFGTWFESNPQFVPGSAIPSTDAEAKQAIEAAKEGRWEDIKGVRITSVELRRPNSAGLDLRWAQAMVPIYTGDVSQIVDAVKIERARRIERAIRDALEGIVPPTKP